MAIKLTNIEKEIIKRIPEEFEYIARDKNGAIVFYSNKPIKLRNSWMDISKAECRMINNKQIMNHFKFVSWEDEEPKKIKRKKITRRRIII